MMMMMTMMMMMMMMMMNCFYNGGPAKFISAGLYHCKHSALGGKFVTCAKS